VIISSSSLSLNELMHIDIRHLTEKARFLCHHAKFTAYIDRNTHKHNTRTRNSKQRAAFIASAQTTSVVIVVSCTYFVGLGKWPPSPHTENIWAVLDTSRCLIETIACKDCRMIFCRILKLSARYGTLYTCFSGACQV
jgi:hypothetical protein